MFKEEETQYCPMCEEWAKKYDQLKEENEQLKKSVRSNKDKRKRAVERYLKLKEFMNKEFEKLKAEKNEIKQYLGISSKTIMERLEELQEFRDKDKMKLFIYEQALQKIKKICEMSPKKTTCDRCHTFGFPPEHELIKLILQKYEEVEEWNKH